MVSLRSLTFAVIAALSLSAPGSTVRAQVPPEEEYARLFREGVAHADGGRLAEAETAFRASLDLRVAPGTLYNLGRVLIDMGRCAEARAVMLRQTALDTDNAARRAQGEAAMAEAANCAARVTIVLHGAATEVLLDGLRLSTTPEAQLLDPGPHVLEVRAANRPPDQRRLRLARGEQVTATFDLRGAAVAAPTTAGTPHPLRPTEGEVHRAASRPIYARWWFWTLVGAAMVGTVTGVAVWYTNRQSEAVEPGNTWDVVRIGLTVYTP